MKFSLFVHMERSDLTKPHSELVAELEELVLLAEQAGFETAWIGEHHGMEFTISPNPFINIAYLGAKTSTHPARHRNHRRALLAPDQARRRSGDGRRHHRRPARHRHRARCLQLRIRAALRPGWTRGAPASACARWSRRCAACGPAISRSQGEFWSFPATTSSPKPLQTAAPADLGRGTRPQFARFRRRQRLQCAGDATGLRRCAK